MNILEQFKTAREVYKSLIKDHSNEIIKEIIKDLGIRFPGLQSGTIIGYTPQFNDGDECEHGSEIEIDYINVGALREVLKKVGIEDEREVENNLTSSEGDIVLTELELIDVILRETHGTNYKFGFVIVDGTVTFKTGYYDCGY